MGDDSLTLRIVNWSISPPDAQRALHFQKNEIDKILMTTHSHLKQVQLGIESLRDDVFQKFFEDTVLINASFIQTLV